MKRIIKIVFPMVLVVVLTMLYLMSNPLRRSEEHLRNYVFSRTPVGSDLEKVIKTIENNHWHLSYVSHKTGFHHQRKEPNVMIGKKSIRASLGDYQGIPFTTNVTVFWGFDKNNKLIDIWVWKTTDGL